MGYAVFYSKTPHIMYKKLLKSLFIEPDSSSAKSLVLLLARIIFGALFLAHGITKMHIYSEMPELFPNPIGLGSTLSLWENQRISPVASFAAVFICRARPLGQEMTR